LSDRRSSSPAVEVANLRKAFGELVALDRLTFTIRSGEICCIVGPNGAGKTTCVECIVGLQVQDSGSVRILGMDPANQSQELFTRVGVLLQNAGIYKRIRVKEAVNLFASMHARPARQKKILEQFGLNGTENQYFGNLSGGQQRRLLTALALIGHPELLILDEPTSGLDPQARYQVWALLEYHRANGGTVLVTTHQLNEAEEYADTVVVLDHGTVLASGRPRELLRTKFLATRVSMPRYAAAASSFINLPAIVADEVVDNHRIIYGSGPEVVRQLSGVLGENVASLPGVEIRPANLEDFFLLETGRAYRSVE
jgi:ABC-2 type transport system ATP-binding protein